MKKALVVPYRYLGDTLLAAPLARGLKRDGYQVEWLVHAGSESILEGQDFADAVFVLTDDNTAALIRMLWRRFDVAFVVNGTDRLTGMARLAAKRVYTTVTDYRFSDSWKRLVVTSWQPFTAHTHTMQYTQGLLALGGVSPSWNASLSWNAADADHALAKASVVAKQYIHIHPFSRVPYKHWPDDCWRELVKMILSYGFDVVITGSSADYQKAQQCFEKINTYPCNTSQRIHFCCGTLNWKQLAALSAKSAAYIGVDTANTHLAAGSGCPVIALFGPTDPRLWGPWPAGYQGDCPWLAYSSTGVQRQGNVLLVQATEHEGQNFSSCVPCQREGCGQTGQSACLETLEANRVWALCLEKIHE